MSADINEKIPTSATVLSFLRFSDDEKANMKQMTVVQENHRMLFMKAAYLSNSWKYFIEKILRKYKLPRKSNFEKVFR